MNRLIILYITNPTKDEAKKIAKHLLDKKMIACGNIIESDSLYNWKGELKDETEFVLLAKTTEDKFDSIKSEVESIHSYDTPCIIKISADSNEKYLNWVNEEV